MNWKIAAAIVLLTLSAILFGISTALQLSGYASKAPNCDDKSPKLSKPIDRMRA